MDTERFDTLVRWLQSAATRRGALALLAGLTGLQVTETDAERRTRAKRRKRSRRRPQRARGANRAAAPPQRGRFSRQWHTDPLPSTIAPSCPDPAAASIAILHASYPGYWWDHTNLTVAVQAHPDASAAHISAMRQAITIWHNVLAADDALKVVTLTDVTDSVRAAHNADIVLHYVPRAGGGVFSGRAVCGDHKCNNVLVRSDLPVTLDRVQYPPPFLGWITLHELGHALGLGHAEPLLATNDLMGYGWPPLAPVLSACDLKGLRAVWAWAIAGDDPYPPTVASVDCREFCRP